MAKKEKETSPSYKGEASCGMNPELQGEEVKRARLPLEAYFKNLLPGGRVYYTGEKEVQAGLQMIDLSRIPSNAIVLYMTGFKYLALQEEASELFAEFGEATLEKLIAKKRDQYPADVPILERALAMKNND